MKQRIARIKAAFNGDQDKLVQVINVNVLPLILTVQHYLNMSLHVSGQTSILALPNRGGNGRMAPTGIKELDAVMISISQCCMDIIRPFSAAIESVEQPVNIRVYDGMCEGATQQWHSDIWGGEPSDMAVVTIPLWGDVKGSGIRFGEPVSTPEAFAQKYPSNAQGLANNPLGVVYDDEISIGQAHIMDSFCLHQSMTGGGVRISIDFRIKYRDKLASDLDTNPIYVSKYKSI